MEDFLLEALGEIGYEGPVLSETCLDDVLEGGPKSLQYTGLVEWLTNHLKVLCNLEEHVNAITSPDDSSAFLLELSSFLKELGCGYRSLTEGHLSQRLSTRESRILLLDYLLTELKAARMIHVINFENRKGMAVHIVSLDVVENESSTASDLKGLLMALTFPKPPAQITPAALFTKVESKLKEVLAKGPKELVGTPLFAGFLSATQWQTLGAIQAELQNEYRIRRQMLIKRLDVTIQSFQWSDRVRSHQDEITSLFRPRRMAMLPEPAVSLADLLAARDDLAIVEKTSSATVRKNTQSAVNKVIIGAVPDRGGRTSEQQAPPPEMPSWEKNRRAGGDGGRGRGGGGFRGSSSSKSSSSSSWQGGERGGRVQGGWSQGNPAGGGGGPGEVRGGGWGRGQGNSKRGGRRGY